MLQVEEQEEEDSQVPISELMEKPDRDGGKHVIKTLQTLDERRVMFPHK